MSSSVLSIANTLADHLIPEPFKSIIHNLVMPRWSTHQKVVVYERCGLEANEMFEAAELYLRGKIGSSTKCFKVHKTPRQKDIGISIEKDTWIADTCELGIDVKWTLFAIRDNRQEAGERRYFEVSFDKKFHSQVMNVYLRRVLEEGRGIRDRERTVKLSSTGDYSTVDMDHPATFETLVMDPDVKKKLIDDLEMFRSRKEYYREVGRAWKRGYLLYGPPGTGKSSLVAAIANHLKYHVHEFQLTNSRNNSEFRETLLSTTNRSIIVIEDIDCSTTAEMQDRNLTIKPSSETQWTLSGLLNFLDGLWSCCGDERIFIFTTNHKDRLDPALLRPGRIDMEIHMSYCTADGFKSLALKYLHINDEYHQYLFLFGEIERLITKVNVTPAEVSGELMRSKDVDTALRGFVNFLIKKQQEEESNRIAKNKQDANNGPEFQQVKRRRTEKPKMRPVRNNIRRTIVTRGKARRG